METGKKSKRAASEQPADAEADAVLRPLAPGLYLVATPIGNAGDVTLRALDILARADAIAAEDTRRTRKLMTIHGIPAAGRTLISYHDRNGAARRPQIDRWLAEGKAVAYCSDAGTPLIADPGFRLTQTAIARGHGLTAAPGPCAALTALALSGLPSDRFFFAGFPPPKSGARKTALRALADIPATLIFYESAGRLAAALRDMAGTLGPSRPAVVARELTKRFEEIRRAPLGELADACAEEDAPKGEIVVLVGPPEPNRTAEERRESLDAALGAALETLSVRDAAARVAARLALPKREVYARALALSSE